MIYTNINRKSKHLLVLGSGIPMHTSVQQPVRFIAHRIQVNSLNMSKTYNLYVIRGDLFGKEC